LQARFITSQFTFIFSLPTFVKMKKYSVPKNFNSSIGHNSLDNYQSLRKNAEQDSNSYWESVAERIDWFDNWTTINNTDYSKAHIEWFSNGKLNASYNCIDRHIENGLGEKTALIWQSNDPTISTNVSYNELLKKVSLFANGLKRAGINKGDRVCIYMQMIPEAIIAMLACARIGAVHSVVFGAFSSDALKNRINDSECKLLITQDNGVRGLKFDIPMKENADKIADECPSLKTIVMVERSRNDMFMKQSRDITWNQFIDGCSSECPPEVMDAEDPLFILYTSGSTGKPKGVMHTTGGYLVYASHTHELVFDYHQDDVYWCTADIGWITGHSYIVYGPLSNAATQVIFEGVPNYPDFGRFWQIVEQHKVNVFYTAPTALRALMKEGDDWVTKYDLSSLKVLGTVGEPIKSPEWHWYFNVIGNEKCPIVDTWWQTETGGILMSPIPGCVPTKPGSATLPLPGIIPAILDEEGNEITERNTTGYLVMTQSWPGQMRTVYGDHQRFIDTYFSQAPGNYFTGDGAYVDDDGYFWITGRVDDVLNVSGHRIGTAEVEGAIGSASGVAEAAVIGYNHEIKGEGIYAFVTLMTGVDSSEEIKKDILYTVTKIIGPHAKPSVIQFCSGLPKTRSGKIMRRILKKIAQNETEDLGDTSTLADPSVIDSLLEK
jgi:acetyl-CoA synthetase|tara:strand:- start:1247 stop:3235 length:1989 start_codon:yes stop_codon:yes gene_type:complete